MRRKLANTPREMSEVASGLLQRASSQLEGDCTDQFRRSPHDVGSLAKTVAFESTDSGMSFAGMMTDSDSDSDCDTGSAPHSTDGCSSLPADVERGTICSIASPEWTQSLLEAADLPNYLSDEFQLYCGKRKFAPKSSRPSLDNGAQPFNSVPSRRNFFQALNSIIAPS